MGAFRCVQLLCISKCQSDQPRQRRTWVQCAASRSLPHQIKLLRLLFLIVLRAHAPCGSLKGCKRSQNHIRTDLGARGWITSGPSICRQHASANASQSSARIASRGAMLPRCMDRIQVPESSRSSYQQPACHP